MNSKLRSGCVAVLLLVITPAMAGISTDATRIIFQASEATLGKSIGLTSSDASPLPYLVKTQITRDIQGGGTQVPFVTTPSLFRLEPGNTHQVLIVKKTNMDELPQDRESVFYFRSVAMPAGEKQTSGPSPVVGGTLQVATATVVKLFYRPAGLHMQQKQAMSMLKFSSIEKGIKATNPTPYFITLAELKVVDKKVLLSVASGNTMIAPFGSQIYPHTPQQGRVEWKAINDYGGEEVFHGVVR